MSTPISNIAVYVSYTISKCYKPTIYQEADGIRQLIAGSYVRKNEQRVGFHVATYDPAKPLVIDPVLVYSTYLGGSSQDYGLSIAADRTGHAYVTGLAQSVDFPTKNPLQPALNGGPDAFVAKLSRDGSKLVYATFLGGSDGDGGTSIAVDRFGQAYVAGSTQSTDFPTRNAVQPTLVGKCEFLEDDFGNVYLSCEPDVFVAKLNSTGSTLIYSTYLGGSAQDGCPSGNACPRIAVDRFGQAYVTGTTNSGDFPTKNPLQAQHGGSAEDAFVAKLNTKGSAFIYSTYLGGSDNDIGIGIAVDHFGQAHVTGQTFSADFPTKKPFQPFLSGEADAFVAKLNTKGSAFIYSTYLIVSLLVQDKVEYVRLEGGSSIRLNALIELDGMSLPANAYHQQDISGAIERE
jgi:hypothetical protein